MTTDQEMRELADKAARIVYIAPTADAGYWRLGADLETKTLMQRSLRWVPDALGRLDQVRELHRREVIAVHPGYGEEAWCPVCQEHYPCQTMRILEGEDQ